MSSSSQRIDSFFVCLFVMLFSLPIVRARVEMIVCRLYASTPVVVGLNRLDQLTIELPHVNETVMVSAYYKPFILPAHIIYAYVLCVCDSLLLLYAHLIWSVCSNTLRIDIEPHARHQFAALAHSCPASSSSQGRKRRAWTLKRGVRQMGLRK